MRIIGLLIAYLFLLINLVAQVKDRYLEITHDTLSKEMLGTNFLRTTFSSTPQAFFMNKDCMDNCKAWEIKHTGDAYRLKAVEGNNLFSFYSANGLCAETTEASADKQLYVLLTNLFRRALLLAEDVDSHDIGLDGNIFYFASTDTSGNVNVALKWTPEDGSLCRELTDLGDSIYKQIIRNETNWDLTKKVAATLLQKLEKEPVDTVRKPVYHGIWKLGLQLPDSVELSKMPEFPALGGVEDYFYSNMKYPANMLADNRGGYAVCQFTIDTLGMAKNVFTLESSEPACEKEVKRLIADMPHWLPAYDKAGERVECMYAVYISFRPQRYYTRKKMKESLGNTSTSRKQADTISNDSEKEVIEQEMPAQEVPMRLLDKLGELYGDNPPGVVGFSVESKNCPDYIGGIYINDQDTLVIQIRGDSTTVRKQLEEALQSKEFIVEPAGAYTQKELMVIQNQLGERREALKDAPALRNVTGWGSRINNIEIRLIVNTPEKRKEFREQIMDSPAFLFVGTETPVEDAAVGVNDVQGVALRPEYTVYSTDTEQVKFILYNQSGGEIGCGEHYHITYEDEEGVWRRLPINDAAVDILYIVQNGGSKVFTASLYPDVHPNRPGRYRFFYNVTIGDMQAGDRLTMMAEFRLTDNKQELAKATKTSIPQTVLGGLTEEEYRKKEDHLFATHVFNVVEVMPEYPDGGHEGLLKYIEESIPKDITKEGRTIISFIVERDGTLSNIEIIRSSSHKELDDEALRIVKKMPKWIPGRQRGKTVRVKFTVPVAFRKKEKSNI